ncbi:hypothetical protein [Paenimyroides baculatum]|uniref:Uncharacterized protein n=1 Tax=Paenimyroides baculatum TaxID=2608000 RepID=A0A5M6CLC0_9FLAO|nr:hypothetical protein [Paenimyroides baculatum]KAA5535826.1 hypothetical protein F0460_05150 [Paenimyroides baculatum]
MNITIVAFDLWGFNKKIVDHLIKQGHEVTFLDLNAINYIYKSKWQRAGNFLNKVFFGKNIKKDYRNKTLIKRISELPKQDYVLIVNPNQFRNDIRLLLRNKTTNFIAYNYDSLARIPLPENHNELFDKIFSFDIEDVQKNSYLTLLTNFIYLDKLPYLQIQNKAFMILSKSYEREVLLSRIANIFDKKGIYNYEFIVANPATKKVNKRIHLTEKHIKLDIVIDKMKNAEILIDLVRPNQTGLSFRIFEAMALQKKIITNNQTIKKYDFYNSNNILVINNQVDDIADEFLTKPYEEIPEKIYYKYTLENFINTLFPNLKKKNNA